MAIIKQSVWGNVARPWGYEIRVDFTDDSGAIHNEVLTLPKEPDMKDIDAKVVSLRSSVESRIAFEVAEKSKPPEPTKEELASKVAILEAEKVALTKQVADLSAPKVVK